MSSITEAIENKANDNAPVGAPLSQASAHGGPLASTAAGANPHNHAGQEAHPTLTM